MRKVTKELKIVFTECGDIVACEVIKDGFTTNSLSLGEVLEQIIWEFPHNIRNRDPYRYCETLSVHLGNGVSKQEG